ncbi:MAG: hypothetical protein JJE13_08430 [Thermoleophilia bacterium]|nr:hypothetical protein [Thermoleophilia bacterium]
MYYPPGDSTFVRTATFAPLSYSDSCGLTGTQFAEPHAYVGIYRRTAPAAWRSLSTFGPPVTSASKTTTPNSADLGHPYDVVVSGVGTPQISTNQTYPNYCNRALFFQGASVSLSDPEAPTVGAITHGTPAPDGTFAWVDSTGNATVGVGASDPGLGVSGTAVYYPKAGGSWDGSHELVTGSAPTCSATASSPCPSNYTSSPTTYSLANFGEGVTVAQGWAWDPLWWAHQDDWWGFIHQAAKDFDVRIDRSPPQIAITGGATGGTGNNLNVAATDGSTTPASARRSGVKSLLVSVDGTQVFNQSQGCAPATGSCPLQAGLALSTSQFDEGPLGVTATAKDQLGDQTGLPHSHQKISTATVYLGGPEGTTSITGGPGGYTADPTPTFTYTSTTSGSAFKCKLDNGSWVTCNPGGFTSGALSDGAHTFYVRNWYGPGSSHPGPASRSFVVDTQGPSISATAPLDQTSSATAGRGVLSDVTAADPGSGAVRITLALDGDVQDEVTQSCPNGACTLADELDAYFTSEETEGERTYELTATDALGNVGTKSGTLVLDAVNPILTVTGDLPDSADALLTGDTAGATIDIDDSRDEDTGVAQVQVLVDGEVDYTQSPSCTSGCPSTYQTGYTYDQTDWSEGAHEVTILASDAAGNTARTTYEINVTPDPPVDNCPAVTPTQQTSHDILTETQAVGGFATSVTAPSIPATDPESDQELNPYWVVLPNEGAPFISEGSLADSTVGSGAAGGFGIDGEFCLMPMQTTSDESSAATVSHEGPDPDDPNSTDMFVDAAAFPNVATDTDLAVRPTATGVAAVAHLRGVQAPSALSWKLGIEDGLELRELSNGGLAIIDPAQEPRGLTVPDRDEDAENIDSIGDVSVQLAEGTFQLGSAEDELDEFVYSVIAAPYGVADDGTVTDAAWTVSNGDTITVDVPAGARQLVMPTFDDFKAKAPKHVVAHHASWEFPSALPAVLGTWGCDFSESLENELKGKRARNMIVDFGPASRDYSEDPGVFGALNWLGGNVFVSKQKIKQALEEAVNGYRDCSPPPTGGQKMRLVLGMSNDGIASHLVRNHSNPPSGAELNSLLLDNAKIAGKMLNATIGSVKKAKPNVTNIAYGVAMDTETSWSVPDLALSMARGMASGPFPAFDYGTAGGCRLEQECWDPWTLEDVAHASQGWPEESPSYMIKALPEIYKKKSIRDWLAVKNYMLENHFKFRFGGVTFQHAAPGQECSTDFRANAEWAWSSFHKYVAPNLERELVQFDCAWSGGIP